MRGIAAILSHAVFADKLDKVRDQPFPPVSFQDVTPAVVRQVFSQPFVGGQKANDLLVSLEGCEVKGRKALKPAVFGFRFLLGSL